MLDFDIKGINIKDIKDTNFDMKYIEYILLWNYLFLDKDLIPEICLFQ